MKIGKNMVVFMSPYCYGHEKLCEKNSKGALFILFLLTMSDILFNGNSKFVDIFFGIIENL